jgi:hypothetical protein
VTIALAILTSLFNPRSRACKVTLLFAAVVPAISLSWGIVQISAPRDGKYPAADRLLGQIYADFIILFIFGILNDMLLIVALRFTLRQLLHRTNVKTILKALGLQVALLFLLVVLPIISLNDLAFMVLKERSFIVISFSHSPRLHSVVFTWHYRAFQI